MSLEEFLSYRPPSYYKILHPPSVDLEWNVTDARDLIGHVLHILPIIEKDKKYVVLYEFVKKKETYLALFKELDELYDKIKHPDFKRDVGGYESDYVDDQYDQKLCYYHDLLIHADFLVARDHAWRKIILHDY